VTDLLDYRFTLPIPQSINSMYVNNNKKGQKGRFKSKEAKKWEDDALKLIRTPPTQFTGEIEVFYSYFFPSAIKRDVANYEKQVSDLMVTKGVIKDDSQIVSMTLRKYVDKSDPRVEGLIRCSVLTPPE